MKANAEPVLVTGGAGFIGSNLAHRLASTGRRVRILDSLARSGVEDNVRWLRESHDGLVEVVIDDVRDANALVRATRGVSAVFHLAAQVAVTSSLVDPTSDFEVNARGTLNVLEAARSQPSPPAVFLTSTNKVYGALDDLDLQLQGERYLPAHAATRRHGIAESRPLDFNSPYGCSKGAADQYVLDYARSFGLETAVLRMSCIYGPRQFGTEDQGWVAHFLLRALRGEPITIFGDGCQVRDVLYVDDLVDAMQRLLAHPARFAGRAFNIGGGPQNAISLNDLLAQIGAMTGCVPRTHYGPPRTGDQRYYVSDTRAFRRACAWRPRVQARDGVQRLYEWLRTRTPARTAHGAAQRPADLAEVTR
ncbi:MAG: NAD-dependent epimerase/dehydratase family protein [Lautropia sp.]